MNFFADKVYKAVAEIPAGKVSTYATIARYIGHPAAARAVGNALNKNPFIDTGEVPCHRVVRKDGSMGGFAYGIDKKIALLESEGVALDNGKVSSQSFYSFNT